MAFIAKPPIKRVAQAQLPIPMLDDNVVNRIVRGHLQTPGQFEIALKGLGIGGLPIGTVETSSQATVQALAHSMGRPKVLAEAQKAAAAEDPTVFDGYVWEACRFDPISPYSFRISNDPYTLGAGRSWQQEIPAHTSVLPLVLAAMHDPVRFHNPGTFDPTRQQLTNTFHFEYGLRECMGRYTGAVIIPEIVRQVLLRNAPSGAAAQGTVGHLAARFRWPVVAGIVRDRQEGIVSSVGGPAGSARRTEPIRRQ